MTSLVLTSDVAEDGLTAKVCRRTRFQRGCELVAGLNEVALKLGRIVDRADKVGIERRKVGADGRRFGCVGASRVAFAVVLGATGSRFKSDRTGGGNDGEGSDSNEQLYE